MFERFTDRARRVVVLAQEEARLLNHDYIGTEHLLLGLVREGDGVAAKALESLGIALKDVRRDVAGIIGEGESAPKGHIPFTPRAKKVLELSLREALALGHNYIGTEHILLGLAREGEGVAAQVLQKRGADVDRVRQAVIKFLSGYEGEAVSGVAQMSELEAEVAPKEPEVGTQDSPTCRNCFAPLAETMAVSRLSAEADDERIDVGIAYCGRCGTAIGTIA